MPTKSCPICQLHSREYYRLGRLLLQKRAAYQDQIEQGRTEFLADTFVEIDRTCAELERLKLVRDQHRSTHQRQAAAAGRGQISGDLLY